MRRIFILMAAALAIAGCSKDLPPEIDTGDHYDPSGIVAFSTDAVTRGTPVDNISGLTDIGTFGYHTGQSGWSASSLPDLMFDRRLYRDGLEWKYDGVPVQWNGSSISDLFTFYAYAPYKTGVWNETTNPNGNGIVVNGNGSTGGVPTLTYTVPADVVKQPDLMVAVPRVDIVKPAGGYVSLTLEHALTTVGFQVSGNGERIAGISISGVSMTGTLAMNGGNIAWTDLGTPSTTDFSASINFDPGLDYYTATPAMSADLMQGDGYLMMIPQTLGTDAMLTVTYVDGTTLDISLDTNEWLPGKKITYELTIVPGGVIVVEPSLLTLPYTASKGEISVDCSDGHDNPAPSLEWTLTTSETWLTLSLSVDGTGASRTLSGSGSQTVYAFATANGTGADRTATVSLDGEENIVTTVKQLYSTAQRFARSNIVMFADASGNRILTFAETEADHTTPQSVTYYDASTSSTVTGTVPAIAANVQGLHFRWGSLVGITGNGTDATNFSSSHVVFWPTEYVSPVPSGSWVWNGNATLDSNEVPFVTGTEIGTNGNHNLDAFAGYPGGTGRGFDKAAGKGDICRYISDMGWVQGRWRMPTTAEITSLLSETLPRYGIDGQNGRVLGEWDKAYAQINNTGAGGRYGYYSMHDTRVVGSGVTGSETAANVYPNPGAAKVIIPAAGSRGSSNGTLTQPGYQALYWSATPSSSAGYALLLSYISNNMFHSYNNFARTNGYSVRCIMAER